jgi:hypothetical protein
MRAMLCMKPQCRRCSWRHHSRVASLWRRLPVYWSLGAVERVHPIQRLFVSLFAHVPSLLMPFQQQIGPLGIVSLMRH